MPSVFNAPVAADGSTETQVRLLTGFVKRCMNQQERMLLMLRYGEGLTWTEVGLVLDLSVEQVRQIHDTVVNRVQSEFIPAASGRPQGDQS